MAASLRRYRELGADFITYTDHDHITDLERARADNPDLVLIPGFEFSKTENMLFVGPGVGNLYETGIEMAMTRSAHLLTIVAHPRPYPDRTYWSAELLSALPRRPDGIEVYNGHYGIPRKAEAGTIPLYAEMWDELLSAGHALWGFANDDSHDTEDFGNAWNMVAAAERTATAVVTAAKNGRFYATTGILAEEVRGNGETVEVRFHRPVTGRFVGPGGRTLSQGRGRRFRHTLGEEAYARFEAAGDEGRIWLQPVHRHPPGVNPS